MSYATSDEGSCGPGPQMMSRDMASWILVSSPNEDFFLPVFIQFFMAIQWNKNIEKNKNQTLTN